MSARSTNSSTWHVDGFGCFILQIALTGTRSLDGGVIAAVVGAVCAGFVVDSTSPGKSKKGVAYSAQRNMACTNITKRSMQMSYSYVALVLA